MLPGVAIVWLSDEITNLFTHYIALHITHYIIRLIEPGRYIFKALECPGFIISS